MTKENQNENPDHETVGSKSGNQRIIVIGASTGGFEAFKKIIKSLPPDFDASIFIVWHMSPDVRGILPSVINRRRMLTIKKKFYPTAFILLHQIIIYCWKKATCGLHMGRKKTGFARRWTRFFARRLIPTATALSALFYPAPWMTEPPAYGL